jgi:hypothetical protein
VLCDNAHQTHSRKGNHLTLITVYSLLRCQVRCRETLMQEFLFTVLSDIGTIAFLLHSRTCMLSIMNSIGKVSTLNLLALWQANRSNTNHHSWSCSRSAIQPTKLRSTAQPCLIFRYRTLFSPRFPSLSRVFAGCPLCSLRSPCESLLFFIAKILTFWLLRPLYGLSNW